MNRSLRFSLLAAATLALATSACMTERELDVMDGDYLPEGMSNSDGLRELQGGAFLAGDIGPVREIANEAEVTSYGEEWDGDRYDTVNLDVYDDERGTWAMIGLNFEGGLDHPALRPGTTHTFSAMSTYGGESPEDLNVTGIGCSDNNTGGDPFSDGDSWEDADYFDAPADEVILVVEQGETSGTKEINVTTVFSDGQQAEGSFTLSR